MAVRRCVRSCRRCGRKAMAARSCCSGDGARRRSSATMNSVRLRDSPCCRRSARRFATATFTQILTASCRSSRRRRCLSMSTKRCNGWLELWYQAKINPHSLLPRGAEALVRVRHPTWGVVAPAYYIPGASDPFLHGLSQFVVARVLADSMQFAAGNHKVQISIRLPLQALEDMQFIDRLMAHLPDRVRQNGFLIAVDCVDLVKELGLVRHVAVQLAARNIGISIDGIDAQGATLAGRRELPVVEMKVDRKYIRGCADDRIKQAHCAQIVAIARDTGAKSVAEGVETQSDFLVVRELGFDLLQGHMFAKPMAPRKFERAVLARRYSAVA